MPHDYAPGRRTALAALGALALAGCASRNPYAVPIVQRGTLATDDRTLAMQAAGAALYEIEAGRLAVARSGRPAVRDYGQMLIEHHGRASAALNALLDSHGLTVPVRLPPQFDARLARLAAEQAGFDPFFVQVAGVQDHRAQVAFFQHASQVVRDPLLRDWFANNLPVLRQHLQAAQALAGTLGA